MRIFKNIFFILFSALIFIGCQTKNKTKAITEQNHHATAPEENVLYFAGGCFWGTEHFFKQIGGVISTEAGYANGNIKDPTYEDVTSGNTGFVETVKVTFDPLLVKPELLIDLYLKTINPLSLNQQGNDIGTQYRTGIYYSFPNYQSIVQDKLIDLGKIYKGEILVENKTIQNFYSAESYHQDYLEKNPNGYCHITPDMFEMARNANPLPNKPYVKKEQKILQKELTPLQYEVTQNGLTEKPFDNEYDQEFREGIYVDITTGEPLFVSVDKYDAGCGWPSFSKPIDKNLIKEIEDRSNGMHRIEIKSKTGDAHLGHVFDDGPKAKGGLRYCVNSAALKFIPKDEMKKKGYEKYLPLLKRK